MKTELISILNELVENAKCNPEHEASYDLIGKVSQSEEVRAYVSELVDNGYIKNVRLYGHTRFSCIVTAKALEEGIR